MASESGQEKRETLADIVSEIRAYGAQPPPRLMWLEIADRIESAWKRENAEWKAAACACVSDAVMSGKVAVEHVPVGNAAAMREALIEIEKMAHIDLCNVYPKYRNKFNNLVGGIERIARAALSTPPRNCDVGTAEEQGERCMAQFDQWRRKGDGKKLITAIMAWAQTSRKALAEAIAERQRQKKEANDGKVV